MAEKRTPSWTAEIIIRPRGRSYEKRPVYVTVEASNWTTGMAKAAREGKKKIVELYKGLQVDIVTIRLGRCHYVSPRHQEVTERGNDSTQSSESHEGN